MRGAGKRQALAVHRQRACIRVLVIAVDDFQQRGFAGPVLTHEGQDLARTNIERDIGERLDIGEGLADIADLKGSDRSVADGLRRGVILALFQYPLFAGQ